MAENTPLLSASPAIKPRRSRIGSWLQTLWTGRKQRGSVGNGTIEAPNETYHGGNDIEKNKSVLKGFFVVLLLGKQCQAP